MVNVFGNLRKILVILFDSTCGKPSRNDAVNLIWAKGTMLITEFDSSLWLKQAGWFCEAYFKKKYSLLETPENMFTTMSILS